MHHVARQHLVPLSPSDALQANLPRGTLTAHVTGQARCRVSVDSRHAHPHVHVEFSSDPLGCQRACSQRTGNGYVPKTKKSITVWDPSTARFRNNLCVDCSDPIPSFHLGSPFQSETPGSLRCDAQIVASTEPSLSFDNLCRTVYFEGSGSPGID